MLPSPWEAEVQRRAQRFAYPPTPNLAARVAAPARPAAARQATLRRRLAWALLVLAVALAGLAAVEPVRAWVAEILRLGAVRIQPAGPTPGAKRTAIPVHLGWDGATSLAEAAAELPFAVQLPTLPPDLGPPDAVYVQDLDGPALLLVWMDPAQPQNVRMTLHTLSSEGMAYKMEPRRVAQTEVNGAPALWTDGPYVVALGTGEWVTERQVSGHVLIWTEGDETYRLETELPLEEAAEIAESLEPLP
jgi:hypothetical protein